MAQLMPLPLTVSCFSKIQIGFTFLVPAHLGSPRKGPLNGCVVCVLARLTLFAGGPAVTGDTLAPDPAGDLLARTAVLTRPHGARRRRVGRAVTH